MGYHVPGRFAVDITVFHYHFLTGGVSTVVRQALAAFRAYLPEIRSIRLVGGRIPREFRRAAEQLQVSFHSIPEIDYSPQPVADQPPSSRRSAELKERLLSSFAARDSIWWIHNHHLGKNTLFTQALLEIIHSGRPQPIVLQVHDFPECGRFENLKALQASLTLTPYPLSPWVRYAVLNNRDRNTLIQAGIPQAAVFLLENPVPAPEGISRERRIDPEERPSLRSRLKRSFATRFPHFDPQAPLLFYPVRTIRRKNALEALLICRLLSANLLITLPGISTAEKGYSDVVERAFEEGACSGLWGIGTSLEAEGLGFEDLVAAADGVLSTSVQEGFGYLFIHTLLWRLPLIARNLDTLSGIKELFTDYPAHFYETITCPLTNAEARSVRAAYRRKLRYLSSFLPRDILRSLSPAVDQLVRENLIDYSYLPVDLQDRILRSLAGGDSQRFHDFCKANRQLLDTIGETLFGSGSPIPSKQLEIEERFGLQSYAQTFKGLIDSLSSGSNEIIPSGSGEKDFGIREQVLRRFSDKQYLRLLYD